MIPPAGEKIEIKSPKGQTQKTLVAKNERERRNSKASFSRFSELLKSISFVALSTSVQSVPQQEGSKKAGEITRGGSCHLKKENLFSSNSSKKVSVEQALQMEIDSNKQNIGIKKSLVSIKAKEAEKFPRIKAKEDIEADLKEEVLHAIRKRSIPGKQSLADTYNRDVKGEESEGKDPSGDPARIRRREALGEGKKFEGKAISTSISNSTIEPNLKEFEKTQGEAKTATVEVRLFSPSDFVKTTNSTSDTQLPSSYEHFRNTFFQQLKEQATPQIVQQAQFLLRTQEDGEIRLILKPEQLGEVKIRLYLRDRLIEGQITVENTTVKEWFEQSRGSLAQAFQDQGLELSNLEVSVGNHPEPRREENKQHLPSVLKTNLLAEQVPLARDGWFDMHRLIDYFA